MAGSGGGGDDGSKSLCSSGPGVTGDQALLRFLAAVGMDVDISERCSRNFVTLCHDGRLYIGIGDVTGPIVETNMFGYAYLPQTDTGLHMRCI